MARTAATNRVANTRSSSVVYNGGFEIKPAYVADTNTANRWIDGTAAGSAARTAFGWAAPSAGSGVGANATIAFDTAQSRSGAASLRLSNLNATGAVTASTIKAATPIAASSYELFPLLPNTSYTLTGYIRTNNVPSNGAFIDIRQFGVGSTFTTLATTSTTKLSGTDTTWRQVTLTFTSNASAAWGCLFLRNNVAGNTCDAWFDDITLVSNASSRVATAGRLDAG